MRVLCCALLVSAGLTCALAAPAAPPGPGPSKYRGGSLTLLLDYAPNVIYADDAPTLCFRIINDGKVDVEASLRFVLADARGKRVKRWERAVRIGSGRFVCVREVIRAVLGNGRGLHVTVGLDVKGLAVAERRFALPAPERLVERSADAGPDNAAPPLQFCDSFLSDAQGRRLIFRARRRARQVERRWAWPKWCWRKLRPKQCPASTALLIVDLPGAREFVALTRERLGRDTPRAVILAPAPAASVPVLRVLVDMVKVRSVRAPRLAVLMLGTSDLCTGTPPEDFRMVLELLLQHLQSKGFTEFLLVAPACPPGWSRIAEAYRARTAQVAKVYKASFARLDAFEDASTWRRSEDAPLVYGWKPTRSGLAAAADELAALVRRRIQQVGSGTAVAAKNTASGARQ